MKIVQVVQRYYPAFGGAENQVKSISEELARRGHDVSVATSNSTSVLDVPTLRHPFRKKRLNIGKFSEINGVKVHRHNALFRFYGFLATTPMHKLLTVEADVIHAYCFYVTTTVGAMLAARWRSLPFLLTANDATVSPYGSLAKRASANFYNHTFGKALLASCARIVAVSGENAEDLFKLGAKRGKVEIIPNGINVKRFLSMKKKPRTIRDDPIVLYVGRISEDKGLGCLIKSAPLVLSNFPRAKFVIVGEDYGYLDRLKMLVQRYGVEKNVVFTGRLSNAELVRVYKRADVFVLPSELEAFGIVVIEAMASGLPVVASNLGGMKTIVQNEKNGLLFEVGNFRELTEKIELLLNNESLRIKLEENGRKTVQEKYSIEKVVDRLEKLYAEVLN